MSADPTTDTSRDVLAMIDGHAVLPLPEPTPIRADTPAEAEPQTPALPTHTDEIDAAYLTVLTQNEQKAQAALRGTPQFHALLVAETARVSFGQFLELKYKLAATDQILADGVILRRDTLESPPE